MRAGGHTILSGITLDVRAGETIAVVGPSGSGKSTLVGLLLGWHRHAEGTVRIDGALLDSSVLEALRETTAWVDPAVQLWNRPLIDNLVYGCEKSGLDRLASILEQADLDDVLARRRGGSGSEALGEGGGLLSGGEGTARSDSACPGPSRGAAGDPRRALSRTRPGPTATVARADAPSLAGRDPDLHYPRHPPDEEL